MKENSFGKTFLGSALTLCYRKPTIRIWSMAKNDPGLGWLRDELWAWPKKIWVWAWSWSPESKRDSGLVSGKDWHNSRLV